MPTPRRKASGKTPACAEPNEGRPKYQDRRVQALADALAKYNTFAIALTLIQFPLDELDRLLSLSVELNQEINTWVASAPPGKEKIRRRLFAANIERDLRGGVALAANGIIRALGIKQGLPLEAASKISAQVIWPGSPEEAAAVQEYMRRLARVSLEKAKFYGEPDVAEATPEELDRMAVEEAARVAESTKHNSGTEEDDDLE